MLLLAGAAATTIIFWRRARHRQAGVTDSLQPLHDLDETSTTLSSVASEKGRDRIESFSLGSSNNYIITPTLRPHLPQRGPHHLLEPIETLAPLHPPQLFTRPSSSQTQDWKIEASGLGISSTSHTFSSPPSLAVSEDSHAPSFFVGDEAKFLSVTHSPSDRIRHCPSASALSCAATIASESISSPTPDPTLTNSSSGTGVSSLGPAIASLMDHKTFILTMMKHQDDLQHSSIDPSSTVDEPHRCESVESDMGESSESIYWKRRA